MADIKQALPATCPRQLPCTPGANMRRRDFIQLGFAAAFLPLPARAQSNVPIIGFLHGTDAQSSANLIAALKEGLAAAGYDVGRNVAIEYRWAEGNADRLPMLAAELVPKELR